MGYMEDLEAKVERVNAKVLINCVSNLWSLTKLDSCPWLYVYNNTSIWGNNGVHTFS